MYKIALCGKANSGKNTTANFLDKEIRRCSINLGKTNIIAFADPIKKMVGTMFPHIPKKHLYGSSKFRSEIIEGAYDKNNNPLTVRQALIDIGTNLGRSYKESIWLEAFEHSYNEALKIDNKSIIIVPDLRFINEFNYLKDKGFVMIRIMRSNSLIINHSSETQQDEIPDNKFNFIIDNNKDLFFLKDQIKSYIIPKLLNL